VLLAKTLRSTTFRLALLSIAGFGAIVIALFSYVYWSTTSFVLGRSEVSIEEELRTLRNTYEADGQSALVAAIEQRMTHGRPQMVYLLVDGSFKPIAGNLAQWPTALKGSQEWSEFHANPENSEENGAQKLFRARPEDLSNGLRLLVGADVSDAARFTNQIRAAYALAILFLFVLATVASVSVTRRTVGRIESINATTKAIIESGLGKRIPVRRSQDEWDRLAQNLNSMLQRIEDLMAEVKQVSDNVAHDLRTPLTRLRGRLERAGAEMKTPDQVRSLITGAVADLDDVLRMFASLMRISQIETANQGQPRRLVNVGEVAAQVAELFDAAAETKGGRVEAVNKRPILISADRDLLFDALANLVDNAIKHGRCGGQVTISSEQRETEVLVAVADDGPGIPADEHEHVFKRFYRLEQSRSKPGNGLGLSLVAAVARLHGARLTLSDNAPGLCVRLHFPIATLG
jgi:signal transduction histidine kinase